MHVILRLVVYNHINGPSPRPPTTSSPHETHSAPRKPAAAPKLCPSSLPSSTLPIQQVGPARDPNKTQQTLPAGIDTRSTQPCQIGWDATLAARMHAFALLINASRVACIPNACPISAQNRSKGPPLSSSGNGGEARRRSDPFSSLPLDGTDLSPSSHSSAASR